MFSSGIIGWRVGTSKKNLCRFLPSATQEQVRSGRLPFKVLHNVTQLVETLACVLPCLGCQTNDTSHAALCSPGQMARK